MVRGVEALISPLQALPEHGLAGEDCFDVEDIGDVDHAGVNRLPGGAAVPGSPGQVRRAGI